jgi:hypothetical protein
MTAILREMACHVDPAKNKDCCTNPGFCEHNDDRRCKAIKGCVNHFPQRAWIFEDIPSITIMREPTSRLLSAWFYRGHSPNNDFFQVRPEFKDIKFGRKPKVTMCIARLYNLLRRFCITLYRRLRLMSMWRCRSTTISKLGC